MTHRKVNQRLDKLQNNWVISSELTRSLTDRFKLNEKKVTSLTEKTDKHAKILEFLKNKNTVCTEKLENFNAETLIGEVEKVYIGKQKEKEENERLKKLIKEQEALQAKQAEQQQKNLNLNKPSTATPIFNASLIQSTSKTANSSGASTPSYTKLPYTSKFLSKPNVLNELTMPVRSDQIRQIDPPSKLGVGWTNQTYIRRSGRVLKCASGFPNPLLSLPFDTTFNNMKHHQPANPQNLPNRQQNLQPIRLQRANPTPMQNIRPQMQPAQKINFQPNRVSMNPVNSTALKRRSENFIASNAKKICAQPVQTLNRPVGDNVMLPINQRVYDSLNWVRVRPVFRTFRFCKKIFHLDDSELFRQPLLFITKRASFISMQNTNQPKNPIPQTPTSRGPASA